MATHANQTRMEGRIARVNTVECAHRATFQARRPLLEMQISLRLARSTFWRKAATHRHRGQSANQTMLKTFVAFTMLMVLAANLMLMDLVWSCPSQASWA